MLKLTLIALFAYVQNAVLSKAPFKNQNTQTKKHKKPTANKKIQTTTQKRQGKEREKLKT